MLVKELIKSLSALNPDDEIWVTYVTKDDISENFSNLEFTDENDNLIDTDKYATNEALIEVCASIDTDDYLWERFSESLRDSCQDVLERLINKVKEAEQDTELWDTNES